MGEGTFDIAGGGGISGALTLVSYPGVFFLVTTYRSRLPSETPSEPKLQIARPKTKKFLPSSRKKKTRRWGERGSGLEKGG